MEGSTLDADALGAEATEEPTSVPAPAEPPAAASTEPVAASVATSAEPAAAASTEPEAPPGAEDPLPPADASKYADPSSGEQPVGPAEPPPEEGFTEPPPAEEPVEEGAPAWVMTFGDLMSLLLTFFILLFSMSSVEVEKFRVAAQSLAEAFGEKTGQQLPDDAPPPMADSIPILSQTEQIVDDVLDQIRIQLQNFVTDNRLEEQVLVAREPEGVFLRLQSASVFGSGSSTIADEGAAILERLGDITHLIEVPVVVTGHTDNAPISSPIFRSNWELSAVRAAGVARALVERGQNPLLVTVEAFGEYRPIAENDTPEGRAQNRRVELYYSRQGVTTTLYERGLIPDPDAAPPAAAADPEPAPAEAAAQG